MNFDLKQSNYINNNYNKLLRNTNYKYMDNNNLINNNNNNNNIVLPTTASAYALRFALSTASD